MKRPASKHVPLADARSHQNHSSNASTTDDAAALDLDPNNVSYTQLADLDTATDKARRDAPAIAVSDIAAASH